MYKNHRVLRIGMGKIKLDGYICERCSHMWISRNIGSKSVPLTHPKHGGGRDPLVCPKCKSPYWNIPRKKKGVKK